jgi:CyaY protein
MSDTPAARGHGLSDSEYQRRCEALLAHIEAAADRWLQDDVIDIDASRTGGLLELRFPNASHLIINTQPPLHEIWLAARGGGFHFRFDGKAWVDTRDGQEFFALFSHHATVQGGVALTLSAPFQS